MTSEEEKQAAFFNKTHYQYDPESIINPPYHTLIEQERLYKELQRRHITSVIDFGSGTGRIALFLLQKRIHVQAVDVSEKSLEVLRDTAQSLGYTGLQAATSLPSKTATQAIVGADILHHINMAEYVPKFYNLLPNKGVAVFTEPGALNPLWYPFLLSKYSWEAEKGIVACTLWNLHEQFKNAGFRNVTIQGVGLIPRSLTVWSKKVCEMNDAVGAFPLVSLFAYRYLIVAEK